MGGAAGAAVFSKAALRVGEAGSLVTSRRKFGALDDAELTSGGTLPRLHADSKAQVKAVKPSNLSMICILQSLAALHNARFMSGFE